MKVGRRRRSRGGDRRGGVQDAPWLCPPFPASCPFRGSITPSPAPATSNRTGGFPASGSPRRRLPSGLCVRSVGACFRAPVHHAVVSKEAPRFVHHGATPPPPAEALALALLGRQSPHLAFDLVLDLAERPPRVADPKVVHPTPCGAKRGSSINELNSGSYRTCQRPCEGRGKV